MTGTPGREESLAARAREAHVVVIGGGISGLVSALECAKVGIRVTVLEASAALGGALRSAEVAGIMLDVGAESYATRGGHVRALAEELGLADAIVVPAGGRAWVAGLPGGDAAPLPVGGVLGIPGNPFDPDVRRIIGWSGTWRAYADRLKPVLTIGHEHSLGRLVRTRMGEKVLDRLVAPIVAGVYSARPDDIDVDLAAPGLNAALTSVGSLSGAVSALRGRRAPGAAPGSAVEGFAGGMSRLVAALADRLVDLGVDIRVGTTVETLRRDGDGWLVDLDGGYPDAHPDAIAADAVVVASDEQTARLLLAPHVAGLDPTTGEPPHVDVVTLVVDAPRLDAHPRGSGVLTVPGSHRAKALTHASAKWAWVAAEAQASAPGRHVVRVSFGAQGEAPATTGLSDVEAAALGLAEASALLGVPLEGPQLVGFHIEHYAQSQPASVIGQADAAAGARASIHVVEGLAAVGAWLAGTGLAQVVPDAIDESERVRQHVLWG